MVFLIKHLKNTKPTTMLSYSQNACFKASKLGTYTEIAIFDSQPKKGFVKTMLVWFDTVSDILKLQQLFFLIILHTDYTHTTHILHTYCTNSSYILHTYCTHTVHILHTYCTHTAHILHTYRSHTAHLLHK